MDRIHLIASIACGALAASPAAAQTYTMIDLGDLGAPAASAHDLDASGAAVGASAVERAAFHAFAWSGGVMTDLPPLAGDTQSWGFAIGADGTVAAASYALGDTSARGFLWSAGVTTPLDMTPRAVNAAGAVAGWTSRIDGPLGLVERAARHEAGVTVELPTLGGNVARAADIDDQGWIVGWSSLAGDLGVHAAIWIDGQPADLGTLGGARAEAYAINAARQVVGYSQRADGVGRACLWTLNPDGSVATRADLGGVNDSASHALGINDAGAVVGSSNARAFVWKNGAMHDLNTLIPSDSGWTLERAWAINGRGQIVGSGLVMGFPRAFLLSEGCVGDFNGDGRLNIFDFLAFQTAFGSGSLEADLAAPFGVLNIFDFLAFQTAFSQGC